MLSIIIPTFNERNNVFKIASRIANALSGDYEIIFVDDSIDDTPEILAELSNADLHVRFEHRLNERGLGTAVVRGFEIARGDINAVIDADLQHPPEVLVTMLQAISAGADIVIPSRYIPGGYDGGLNPLRKIISATARFIGKVLLKKLRPISDCTSGFFMFRKNVIEGLELQPIGWKILIEVLIRGKYNRVIEIPYSFQMREEGDSKMSLKEQWNYIHHLGRLVASSPEDRRFFFFALVGLSGVIVNMLIYSLLTILQVEVRIAGFISAFVVMLSNFSLNDKITWASVRTANNVWVRSARYIITSLIGVGINIEVLSLLYYHLYLNHLLANLIGIFAAVAWNYIINNLWTWCPEKPEIMTIVEKWKTVL
jgi:dolichol-phosphate mannosyltransferase